MRLHLLEIPRALGPPGGGVMAYAIRHNTRGNQTYFVKWVPLGPMFGGTRREAARFATKADAARTMLRHWAFLVCRIEPVSARPVGSEKGG